jgi:FlaA1/EpsC-like NDP-sugar epimerase
VYERAARGGQATSDARYIRRGSRWRYAAARSAVESGIPPLICAFIDDDLQRWPTVHGKAVAGSGSDLPQLVKKMAIDEVLIATPSATGEQMNGSS